MADKNGLDTVFDNVVTIPNRSRTREDRYTISCTKVRHVLFLVPGTTDPVNINEHYSNDASMGYWDKTFLEDIELFTSDLAIDDIDYFDTFRWSGDNNFCSRYAAGKKLENYIHAHLEVFEAKHMQTHIHFICHSHGGNVIHEFTNIAAENKNFPKHIQVKSIFYLSTPFFKDQAQLNHKILHPNCTIVNVFNKYDLTQRFVANFTMHYMPALVKTFDQDEEFHTAIKTLKETPFLTMGASATAISFFGGAISVSVGSALWTTLLNVFNTIDTIFVRIVENVNTLNNDHPSFITPAIQKEVIDVIDSLKKPLTIITTNLKSRLNKNYFSHDYDLTSLLNDIGPGVIDLLRKLNTFIELESPGSLSSPLMSLIDKIILNQIDKFDDTTDTPEPQLKGKFNYQAIDVTEKDPYDCTEASENYDQFIDALEKLEDDYTAAHPSSAQPGNKERIQACKSKTRLPYTTAPNGRQIRSEIIFKLLAQEDYGFIMSLDELLVWLEKLLGKNHYPLITKTRSNIAQYKKEFDARNDRILHRETIRKEITITKRKKYRFPILFSIPSALLSLIERNIDSEKKIIEEEQVYSTPFGQAAGGLPYLAVISHSVSRRLFYPEVADALAKLIPNKSVKHAISVKKCK